mgnify:CR=1 FL=1
MLVWSNLNELEFAQKSVLKAIGFRTTFLLVCAARPFLLHRAMMILLTVSLLPRISKVAKLYRTLRLDRVMALILMVHTMLWLSSMALRGRSMRVLVSLR